MHGYLCMDLLCYWVGCIIVWANICLVLLIACWAICAVAKLNLDKWRNLRALHQQHSSQTEQLQLDSLEIQPEHL
jgi:hypothetical protein